MQLSPHFYDKLYGVQVLQNFHTLLDKQDHSPLVIQLRMMLEVKAKPKGKNTHIRDYRKYDLTSDEDTHRFAQCLNQIPLPPWHIGHDAHKAAADAALMYAMHKSYSLKDTAKRRKYLSDHCWALVCARTSLRAAARLFNAAAHPFLVHQCMNLQDFISGDNFATWFEGLTKDIRLQSKLDFNMACQTCVH